MVLTPEKPAQGILVRTQSDSYHQYQVVCSCGHDGHTHEVFVELEPDLKQVSVTVYTKVETWKNRWRYIWQLLTRGHLELETSLLLDQQQAINYAHALTQAVDKLNKEKNATV